MEVLSALRFGIERIPTGGNGGEHLDVFLTVARIEYQRCLATEVYRLEKGEVGVGAHGLLEDVVELHILLVVLYYACHTVCHCIDAECRIGGDGIHLRLQVHLHHGELLYRCALFGTAHLVAGCHCRVGGLYAYGLGGVDCDVYDLSGDAQTVEFGGVDRLAVEAEGTVVAQLYGVDCHGTVKAHVLEIECGVLGIGDGSFHTELALVARGDAHCHECQCCHDGRLCQKFYVHFLSILRFLLANLLIFFRLCRISPLFLHRHWHCRGLGGSVSYLTFRYFTPWVGMKQSPSRAMLVCRQRSRTYVRCCIPQLLSIRP